MFKNIIDALLGILYILFIIAIGLGLVILVYVGIYKIFTVDDCRIGVPAERMDAAEGRLDAIESKNRIQQLQLNNLMYPGEYNGVH